MANQCKTERKETERKETKRKENNQEKIYPWLPADDPANLHRYWVPSPEEIARQKEQLRLDAIESCKTRHHTH